MKTPPAPPAGLPHGYFCGFAVLLITTLLYLTGGLFPDPPPSGPASPPGTQFYYELDRQRIDAADAAERQQELHLAETIRLEAEWNQKLTEATERLRLQRELDEFNLEPSPAR